MGNASGCRKSQGTLEDEGGLWKKVFGGKIETPCFIWYDWEGKTTWESVRTFLIKEKAIEVKIPGRTRDVQQNCI